MRVRHPPVRRGSTHQQYGQKDGRTKHRHSSGPRWSMVDPGLQVALLVVGVFFLVVVCALFQRRPRLEAYSHEELNQIRIDRELAKEVRNNGETDHIVTCVKSCTTSTLTYRASATCYRPILPPARMVPRSASRSGSTGGYNHSEGFRTLLFAWAPRKPALSVATMCKHLHLLCVSEL